MSKVHAAFQELYIPPLGPHDDPPGVIYLNGKLTEKTVDVTVLNSVGEGVLAARKALYDSGSRRRSLMEEVHAQKKRVSAPKDPVATAEHFRKEIKIEQRSV